MRSRVLLRLVSESVCLPVVRSGSRVKHFKIHQGDDGFHIEPKHHFSSLIDVVDFYCANSLNTTGQLGKPCKKVSLHTAIIYSLLLCL